MKNPIILTRLAHPATPVNIIGRQDLMELMRANSNKKLILLNAPAGYGKTTLVNDYLHKFKKSFGWIRLHKDINSGLLLLLYIIESLRKINKDFGRETLNTISQLGEDSNALIDQESALRSLLGLFSNEFTQTFSEEIILVLDDLHELSSSKWLNLFIDLLMQETPDNLCIITTARYLSGINISSFKAKRSMIEITQKELSLSSVEIKLLAKTIYGINFTNEDADHFIKYIGGWVTGIHLLLQVPDTDLKFKDLETGGIPENLFDFFAEEVFLKQDNNIKNFLLKTSFLEIFESELCDELLKTENSREILEYLSGKNIFIETAKSTDSGGRSVTKYSYNQLFRVFLREKARITLGNELNDVLRDIAEQYVRSGNTEEAIDYYLLAKDFEKALLLLKDSFQDQFQRSNFEQLWKYVHSFEESFHLFNKHLLYYKGILSKYYRGNIDEALIFLNKAITLAEEDNDNDFLVSCILAKAEILINQGSGKVTGAIELLNSVLTGYCSPIDQARTYFLLGSSYFNVNKHDMAVSFLEKALKISSECGINELEPDIYSMLGNINIIKGEFVLSHHYYELTLNKTKGLFKKLVAQGNLTVLYSRSGKFSLSKESLIKSKELLKMFKTPIFELIIKMTDYTLWFEMGDYLTATIIAQEINEAALKLSSSNYIFLSYQFLGECSYYSGNPVKAIEYYNLSRQYIDESNEGDDILLKLLIAISELKISSSTELETKLLRYYTYLDAISSNYDKAVAGFFLAMYYLNNGNKDTALKYFEKTTALAVEKEYYSFLLREYINSEELFLAAESKNIQKEVVSNLRLSMLELSELDWISKEYSDYLQNKIASGYSLKMNIFGSLEFFVGNTPVKESDWKRKKRKLILCYLLMNKGMPLGKDKIIDLFFQESSVENSDNLFHQSISNIRTALKSANSFESKNDANNEAEEKQFIVYEGKMLKLAQGISFYSDASEFDRLFEKASIIDTNPEKISCIISAVKLYKGEALEGFYEPWCENIRSEYRNKFIKTLESLVKLFDEENRYSEIENYSEKIIQTDSLNELAHTLLIKSLVKTGKSKLAKEKYTRLKDLYRSELNENIPSQLNESILSLFE